MTQRSINYSLDDLAKILLEREDIHKGYWEIGLAFEGQAAMTALPSSGGKFAPSMIVRVVGINLVEQLTKTPASVEAQ